MSRWLLAVVGPVKISVTRENGVRYSFDVFREYRLPAFIIKAVFEFLAGIPLGDGHEAEGQGVGARPWPGSGDSVTWPKSVRRTPGLEALDS